uniref:Vacuolar iron transporter 1 n=1 Tax=Heterosigma akashiwo TaxID=2829 RepID=A0A6V1NR54_HETAK|mmetsp:Transcript_7928/g.11081  ORF Transcript_7928/g.11081 Transcript_7928/m.11081 type:complete len:292 (-) Transcript_7928:357-1232(-)
MNIQRGPKAGEGSSLVRKNSGSHVNYSKARKAYAEKDVEALRNAHDNMEEGAHDDHYTPMGEKLKAVVFGGLDGVLTSFAIIAGAAGGGMGVDVVLVLGFSNIVADALSMGVGEYLSSRAHAEYVLSERRREEWELRNHREGEVREMVEIYVNRGMARDDAEVVLNRIAKYDEFFVNVMMAEELGMPANGQVADPADTVQEGLIMFAAFAVFGSMPLLGYCVVPALAPDASSSELFAVAVFVTLLFLFGLGAVKSHFSTKSWYCSGIETLLLGGCCAGIAYEIGNCVQSML